MKKPKACVFRKLALSLLALIVAIPLSACQSTGIDPFITTTQPKIIERTPTKYEKNLTLGTPCDAYPFESIEHPIYDRLLTWQDGDQYYYSYYLGYLDKVPLHSDSDWKFYFDGMNGQTIEVQTGTVTSESMAQAVTNSVSKSTNWQKTLNVSDTISVGLEHETSAEVGVKLPIDVIEVGAKIIEKVKTKIEAEISVSNETSHGASETEEVSKQSSVSNTKSIEQATTTTTIFDIEKTPLGYYRCTNACTVDVFAVIVYDALNGLCYTEDYKIVRDNIYAMIEYVPTAAEADNLPEKERLPFSVAEAEEEIESLFEETAGFIYREDDKNAHIVGYVGGETDIVIPSYHRNEKGEIFRVVDFEKTMFSNTAVTSVKFGKFITTLPNGSFKNCTALKNVEFVGELSEIGSNTFEGCSSLSFEIPKTVTTVGNYAFSGCDNMNNMTLPQTIVNLGNKVFDNCNEMTVEAFVANANVATNVLYSGATNIKMNVPSNTPLWNNIIVTIPENVKTFELIGEGKTFTNVKLISSAEKTIINKVSIQNTNSMPALQTTSREIELYNVTLKSNAKALDLSADTTELLIRGNVDVLSTGSLTAISATGNLSIRPYSELVSGNLKVNAFTAANDPKSSGKGITVTGDLSFNGFLQCEIHGGNGADGIEPSENGKDGGIAIVCDNLTVDMKGALTVYGGNGGNGADGKNGDDGKNGESKGLWNSKNGENGENGENGANGGTGGIGSCAIIAKTVQIFSSIHLQSGNAGDGGNGGNGGKGGNGGDGGTNYNFFNTSAGKGGNGGYGGVGGSGGKGGDVQKTIYSDSLIGIENVDSLIGKVGTGGNKGLGNIGGNGGSGGWARTGAGGINGSVTEKHMSSGESHTNEKAIDGINGESGKIIDD